MNLYENDYTKLSEVEDAEHQAISKSKTVGKLGNFDIKRAGLSDYPKASRHFMQLFPNNWIDIVSMREEERLKAQLERFVQTLNLSAVREREILSFIKGEKAYFIVASLLSRYFYTGHHGAFVFPEFQLGTSFVADYLLVGEGSDGWRFIFVELEAPTGSITLKDGSLGNIFRKGIKQIDDWKWWIQTHYCSLKEVFNKSRHPEKCLPDAFSELDQSRISYVVVAGRRSDFNSRTYRIRRAQKESELLLHYDNLVDSAERVITYSF